MRRVRATGRRRRLAMVPVLCVTATVALVLGAMGSAGAAKKDLTPWKVALVSDLTGACAATSSLPGSNGFQVGIKQINADGGAGKPKRQIDLSVADSQCTPSGAQGGYQQAVANGAQVVATGSATPLTNLRPLAAQAQLPLISGGALDVMFSAPWFYAAQAPSDRAAYANVSKMAELLGGSLKGKKIAFAFTGPSPQNEASIQTMADMATNAGATVVDREQTAFGLSSFASGAGNIVSKAPDGVIASHGGPDTVVVAKGLLDAGFKGPILGSSGASDDTTFQAIANPQYYALREQNQATDTNAMGKAAKKFGISAVGSYFPKGWVNAYTLKQVLDRCKYPCNSAAFQKAAEALGTLTVPGDVAIGDLMLTPTQHWSNTAVQFWTWDAAKKAAVTSGDPTPLSKQSANK